ncbi:MAG TPA: glutamate-cysteine ligase family protein [Candidatus Acidoferrales bacterium]|nr:glutamate-cysteine ligase family protein [Candidatus Acidoferrales bacterium]
MQQPIPRRELGGPALAPPKLDVEAVREFLRAHQKPVHAWRVGIEYEVIGYERDALTRIQKGRVAQLLEMLCASGGVPALERSHIIAVRMPYGDITLEPGGQIEFSGFPELELADNAGALCTFITDLHRCADELGIFFIGLGFDPLCDRDAQSWIDKQRYAIMRPYLGKRGPRAWDMMTRTAAAQVSLDYGDDADLARKYVLGNRAGPIVAAMFAASPFSEGVATGYKSNRYAAWLETDADRTGPGPASLDERFDLERYAEQLLQVPAFFVERDGMLYDVHGQPLAQLDGADADDLPNLLSMVFTEARIREYVEMRSADGSTPERALALAAFWKGLTYDPETCDQALRCIPRLDQAAYHALQETVAKDGLAARVEGVDVLALAKDLVSLGMFGLAKIAPEELPFLDELAHAVLIDEVCPADVYLKESKTSSVAGIARAHAVA